MKIRTADVWDFPEIARLYRQLQPDDPSLVDGPGFAVFKEIVDDDRLHLFVLEGSQGKIASTCYLNILPNLTRTARPYAVIENVVTDEALRGRGFGKQVVQAAIEAAWEAGCYKVMLMTGSDEDSTHAFYAACGFSGDDKHAYVAWRPGSS